MIDFHTHILPGIDDGSRSVHESIEMLLELRHQRVKTVVATPHFDMKKSDVDTFLKNRRESYQVLAENMKKYNELPNIILGAEVLVYRGLFCNMEGLEKLCIGNTKYILTELPSAELNEDISNELLNTVIKRRLTPMVAHINRNIKSKRDLQYLKSFLKIGAINQMNADYINNIFTRNKAIWLIKKGYVQVLGSDCHDMGRRRPNLNLAYKHIGHKLGGKAVKKLEINSHIILNHFT